MGSLLNRSKTCPVKHFPASFLSHFLWNWKVIQLFRKTQPASLGTSHIVRQQLVKIWRKWVGTDEAQEPQWFVGAGKSWGTAHWAHKESTWLGSKFYLPGSVWLGCRVKLHLFTAVLIPIWNSALQRLHLFCHYTSSAKHEVTGVIIQ